MMVVSNSALTRRCHFVVDQELWGPTFRPRRTFAVAAVARVASDMVVVIVTSTTAAAVRQQQALASSKTISEDSVCMDGIAVASLAGGDEKVRSGRIDLADRHARSTQLLERLAQ